jgi:ComF family protein
VLNSGSRVLASLASLPGELLDLIAPPACPACDAPTARATAFCDRCADAVERCPRPEEHGVFAPFVHGGPLAITIHRVKFGRAQAATRALGALLREGLGGTLSRVDVVVPVPLHPRRLRERGFNQSAEIARALGPTVTFDALSRVRETAAQARLSREDRARNVRGAFVPGRARAIAGRTVLLLDDVVTTGATLSSARAALEALGPREILCAAVARAVLESAAVSAARPR